MYFLLQSSMETRSISKLNVQMKAALIDRDFNSVKNAIRDGAQVNAVIDQQFHDTPLHMAVRSGQLTIVDLLLKSGANPNVPDKDNFTTLRWAVNTGHIPIIEKLVDHSADVHTKDKHNRSLLHGATMHGNVKVMNLLIKKYGIDPNYKDKWGDTALHKACHGGHFDCVLYLLKIGVPRNILNFRCKTPDVEIPLTHERREDILELFNNPEAIERHYLNVDIDNTIKVEIHQRNENKLPNVDDVEVEPHEIGNTNDSRNTVNGHKEPVSNPEPTTVAEPVTRPEPVVTISPAPNPTSTRPNRRCRCCTLL